LALTTEVNVMSLKTLGKCIWLVLTMEALSASGRAKTAEGSGLEVKVSVFNDAQIDDGRLTRAERVASELFAHAGIQIDWMNCGNPSETDEERAACSEAAYPKHLQVRVRQQSLTLKESTLGLSYLGEDGIGCHADVFYAGIAPIAQEAHLSSETILGLVFAHELGHLLLGTNSHSASGIMRATWQGHEFSAVGKGALGFTEVQGRKMKTRLEARPMPNEPVGASLSR
jgi:hypothetical protein